MIKYSMEIVLLAFFVRMAYQDGKEKQVDIYIPVVVAFIGIVLQVFDHQNSVWEIGAGVGVGILVLVISWITGGSVGAGDGMMLMVSGIFLGFWRNLSLFMTAQILVGTAALFMVVVKKRGRKYRLPFVPFLLAAYLFQLL